MPITRPNAVRAAAAEMDAQLARPGAFDGERFAALLEAQRQVGLTYGSRALCRHLRPYLLTAADYAQIGRAAELITAALSAVAERARSDSELASELGLSADERALAAIDPGYPQLLAVGRLDMLVTDAGFDFIELNADSPAGITDQLLVERTLFRLPHIASLRERLAARCPAPHVALLAALREIYASWGGRESRPSIAIVDWQAVDTAGEAHVLATLFRDAGHRTEFVDPGELRYDGHRLYARGEPVDLVYRRVIVQELIDRCGLEHALVRAYCDHAVCVANSFRTKPLNKKAAFAVLSDPRFSALFTPEQRRAIERHVPWTRTLRRPRTLWHGRPVQLRELMLAEREQLVLKPNDEYGGKGVLLGWQTQPEIWAEAVARGAEQGLVVQERRYARTVNMPTFRDRLVHDDLYFDLCPFVFAGRMAGAMTRLATSPLTNVSAGAEVSALLILDQESQDV